MLRMPIAVLIGRAIPTHVVTTRYGKLEREASMGQIRKPGRCGKKKGSLNNCLRKYGAHTVYCAYAQSGQKNLVVCNAETLLKTALIKKNRYPSIPKARMCLFYLAFLG